MERVRAGWSLPGGAGRGHNLSLHLMPCLKWGHWASRPVTEERAVEPSSGSGSCPACSSGHVWDCRAGVFAAAQVTIG